MSLRPAIDVEEAEKTFGDVVALHRTSFSIAEGDAVGLLGPNGSGKTTLLRLLAAWFPPTRGRVRVAGYDTAREPLEVHRRIGYAAEGVVLYPELTVADFLSFAARVKGASPAGLEAAVERCGLAGWLDRRIGTLSKGYRQRLVLAQAILADPPVLLLDEPTVGMDPEMAVGVRRWLRTLSGSRTVVLSTHSLGEARALCGRVLVLHEGRILADGAPQELLSGTEAEGATVDDLFLRLVGAASRQR